MLLKLYEKIMRFLGFYFYRQFLLKRMGDVTIGGIKPYRQTMSYNCGMTSLKTIGCLTKRSTRSMIKQMNGVTISSLCKNLDIGGAKYSIKKRMRLGDVKKNIDKGRCIITSTNHSGGHWAVIFGYYDNGIIISGCSKTRYDWDVFYKRLDGGREESIVITAID